MIGRPRGILVSSFMQLVPRAREELAARALAATNLLD